MRHSVLMALVSSAFAIAACGDEAERAAPSAAGGAARQTAPSVPCDDAMRRPLEAQVRGALERMPREEGGIVYGQVNSGCAMIRVPAPADSQP